MMNKQNVIAKQSGAALIVGLILLVVITVLAISGMNTATTELAMARNNQTYENVFQAAETGLETALAQGSFAAVAGGSTTMTLYLSSHEKTTTTIEYEDSTMVPDRGKSRLIWPGLPRPTESRRSLPRLINWARTAMFEAKSYEG